MRIDRLQLGSVLWIVLLGASLSCSQATSSADAGTAVDADRPSDASEALPDASALDAGAEPGLDAGGPDAESAGADAGPCEPGATCTLRHDCMGYVDNSNQTAFALRVGQVQFSKPRDLATGLVADLFAGAIAQKAYACKLYGGQTATWLLGFDTAAKTLKLGGAKPVADPAAGYSFVDETVAPFQVQPALFAGTTLQAGSFATAPVDEVVLPLYLDATAIDVLLLPLRHLALQGTLSPDQGCIGRYNADGLDPDNDCQPDSTNAAFLPGGSGTGCISLEQADAVVIEALSMSLCVLLSGDASTYGTASAGNVLVCRRDGQGQIVFQGDWCLASNAAASAGCADAVSVAFDYEAGSVLLR